jgi:hypothetical protein
VSINNDTSTRSPNSTSAPGRSCCRCPMSATATSSFGSSTPGPTTSPTSAAARPAPDRARASTGVRRAPGDYCLSELGCLSSRAGSGCGRWCVVSLRGCPALSGSATWWSVTGWLMGQSGWSESGWSDSGRSVFGGPPPVDGSRSSCGSWSEAWSSSRSVGRSERTRGAVAGFRWWGSARGRRARGR